MSEEGRSLRNKVHGRLAGADGGVAADLKAKATADRAEAAQLDRQQRESEAVQQATQQQFDHLLVQGAGLVAENPLVGVPTTLFIAWMRRSKLKTGEQVLAKFDAQRAEQGKSSLVPGDTLSSVDAENALGFLRDNGLEESWKSSPEAQVTGSSELVATPDPLAGRGGGQHRAQGPAGPSLG